jgi:hypothetical protein
MSFADDDFNFFLPDTLLEDSDSDGEGGGESRRNFAAAGSEPGGNFPPQSRLLSGLTRNPPQDKAAPAPANAPTFVPSTLPHAGGNFEGQQQQYNMYPGNGESLNISANRGQGSASWMQQTARPESDIRPGYPTQRSGVMGSFQRQAQSQQPAGSQPAMKRMSPAATAPPFPTTAQPRMAPASRLAANATRAAGASEHKVGEWSQSSWQMQNKPQAVHAGMANKAMAKPFRPKDDALLRAQKASPLGNLDSWGGGPATLEADFKKIGTAKKLKPKDAKLVADMKKEDRKALQEKEREQAKKRQQEIDKKTQARIAAAREEVNEPVFMSKKKKETKAQDLKPSEIIKPSKSSRKDKDKGIKGPKINFADEALLPLSFMEDAENLNDDSEEEDGESADNSEVKNTVTQNVPPALETSDENKTENTSESNRANSVLPADGSGATAPDTEKQQEQAGLAPVVQKKSPEKDKDRDSAQGRATKRDNDAKRDLRTKEMKGNRKEQQEKREKRSQRPSEPATDAVDTSAASTFSILVLLPPVTTALTSGLRWTWHSSSIGSKMLVDLVAVMLRFVLALHKKALNGLTADHHVAFCFTFLYSFPYLVSYITPWAPPWAPVCLWYAFLVQLFCIQGQPKMVMVSRRVLPVMFVLEGVSHHSFLLDLNGSERLVFAFLLSALKTRSLQQTICLLSMVCQVLLTCLLGWSTPFVQWIILIVGLSTITPDNLTSIMGDGVPSGFTGSDGLPPGVIPVSESRNVQTGSSRTIIFDSSGTSLPMDVSQVSRILVL